MAGYSKRPLAEKLGIKEGWKIALINVPAGYGATLGKLPRKTTVTHRLQGSMQFIQFFARRRAEIEREFASLKRALVPNGVLWISWPKGSSGAETDLNENVIREISLTHGLVDVKVCAVDDTWSGLKLVYRSKDRESLDSTDGRR